MASNPFRKRSLGDMPDLPFMNRDNDTPRSSITDHDDELSLDDDDSPAVLGGLQGPGDAAKSPPTAHCTRSLMAIMDEHLMTTLKAKQGIVRSEIEAFEPLGSRTYPTDRRKEFRAYLGHTKFIQAITNLIIKLYKLEKWPEPAEAVDFIAMVLGYALTLPVVAQKQKQREDDERTLAVKAQIAQVQKDIDVLRRQLDDYEDTEVPIEIVNPETLPPFKLQKGHTAERDRGAKSKNKI